MNKMNNLRQLHFIQQKQTNNQATPIIFLHGLFGSASNLTKIAKPFAQDHHTIQVDLRNHGLSPWSDCMNYDVMSDDLQALIKQHCDRSPIIIGHSMGGKVAMRFAKQNPHCVESLIVLDIAPVNYPAEWHQPVFQALKKVSQLKKTERENKVIVQAILSEHLPQETVQFLIKSFKNSQWLFNLDAILKNQNEINSWNDEEICFAPTLFLKGEHSPYVNFEGEQAILTQFPISEVKTIQNAGHNVHFDQPDQVVQTIQRWIES